jgi:hypothetical protein
VSPLTYADLDMSRLDAHVKSGRELLIALPTSHAKVLIALLENTGKLQRAKSFASRLGPAILALSATFRALLFHRKLIELARVIADLSEEATWKPTEGGHVLFRFTP